MHTRTPAVEAAPRSQEHHDRYGAAMHVLRAAGVTAMLTACLLLPYLPGRYDVLATPVSMIAQFVGLAGLVVVPFGVAWIVAARAGYASTHRVALAAIIALSAVWFFLSFVALTASVVLGIILMASGIATIIHMLRLVRSSARTLAVPVLMATVPVAMALIQYAVAGPITQFSRNRAIENSGALIAAIEEYRAANGRYPQSLISMWPDINPGIIGIRTYDYEAHGDAYNVMFEQPSFELGVREVVMYNPRNEHALTSHRLDRLQLTAAQLAIEQTRGHNMLHDGPRPYWKYYWFD